MYVVYSVLGGTGGLFLDPGSNNGPSFLPLPVQLLEQIMTGAQEPGVTTLRMPQPDSVQQRDPHAREVDIEVCFVCKKCRVAFSSESNLLTHQRQCFGGNLDNRGAYRIVQTGCECKLCPNDKFKSIQDFKKHAESDPHTTRVLMGKSAGTNTSSGMVPPPPSESPLSHEMEDVVNQITLLAARAAQEASSDGARVSTSVDSNSNSTFCQPSEPKRRFLAPGDVAPPLTSAGH